MKFHDDILVNFDNLNFAKNNKANGNKAKIGIIKIQNENIVFFIFDRRLDFSSNGNEIKKPCTFSVLSSSRFF